MCIYIYIYKALLLFFVLVRACNNKFSMHLMSSKQSVHHPSLPPAPRAPFLVRHLRCSLSTCLAAQFGTHTHTHTHTETLYNFCIVLDALQHITHTHSRLTSAWGGSRQMQLPLQLPSCAIFLRFSCICTALCSLYSTCLSLAPVFGGRPKICCNCIFLKFCANIWIIAAYVKCI